MDDTQVIEYSVTDAAIAKMHADYMGLTVNGIEDKAGFAMVHTARMDVKNKRIAVEKRRKELKAEALAWSKKVDGRANEIFAKLAPIEEHLDAEEGKITKLKARLEAEAKRKREEQAQARVDKMAAFGASLPFLQAMEISEGDFQARLIIAEDDWKKEQARAADEKRKEAERIESERKAREDEAARLEAERAELERIRAEEDAKRKAEEDRLRKEREAIEAQQRAEREKLEAERRAEEARARAEREAIEAERRKVEDTRREYEHREAVAKAEKEASERAIREAKEKAERETREKAEAESAAKAEAERKERLRPDREKLQLWAAALLDVSCTTPESPEAKAIVAEARKRLVSLNRYIVNAAQEL